MSEIQNQTNAGMAPSRRRGPRGPLVALGLLLLLGAFIGWQMRENPPEAPGEEAAGLEIVVGEAPAPRESERVVRVETTPAGASLFVQGRLVGGTPLTLSNLKPGFYSILLEKEGHVSKSLRVNVGDCTVAVRETLDPVRTAVLAVDSDPPGAEVLLDGELAGFTPLRLEKTPAGQHELLIRKTNFKPDSARIELVAGKTYPYVFKLSDKILTMLQSQVKVEPQRIAHYIDLGHYLFITNQMDQAVDAFIQAQEVDQQPLEFAEAMGPAERALELRLRNEDRTRLKKEIDKHKQWPGRNTLAFREKLEQALEIYSRKNMGSWTWVEMAARDLVRNGNYARAEQLFLGHLKDAPQGPHAVACMLELLKARLSLRNLSTAGETFQQLYPQAKDRPDLLLDIGQALATYKDRVRPSDRGELLEMAEKCFRRALEITRLDALKSECAFELGSILTAQKHAAEAVAYLQQAVAGAPSPQVREDRQIQLAEALRQAGRFDEALQILAGLAKSERVEIREQAKARVILIQAERK